MIKNIVLVSACSLLMACSSNEPQDPSSLNKDPAMWQKFQGQKSDKALDKEMEDFRKMKKAE